MWIRYVLVGIIALLVGVVLGGYLVPVSRAAGQPAIAVFEPIPEGMQSWRFVVANPRTGKLTVYEVDSELRVVGSARY